MKPKIHVILIVLIGCYSCRKEERMESKIEGYDIILNIGQSNTHYGDEGPFSVPKVHPDIKQLGRFGENNMEIIAANEPLEHHSQLENSVGFATTFAELYRQEYLQDNRQLLIIPCGQAGSGFQDDKWSIGGYLYTDAFRRVEHIYQFADKSKVVAILWHQGENDIGNEDYQHNLDEFIEALRTQLKNKTVPFILGGMVPYWVNQSSDRKAIQSIIKDTPNRLINTGYADPTYPFVIEKEIKDQNAIHYDGAGLIELGRRYFKSYQNIVY